MESEQVLRLLRKVPRGKVTTYKALANASGSKGYRAVGQIMRRNSRPDLYPCYKVVKSDGSIGGYSGMQTKMLRKKVALLESDGIKVVRGKVNLRKHLFRV